MVVQHGEGHELLTIDFDGAFEIDLPEIVGAIALETLKFSGGRPGRLDASIACQDGGNGANRRWLEPMSEQVGMNLTWPPVEAIAQVQDMGLDVIVGAGGRANGFA